MMTTAPTAMAAMAVGAVVIIGVCAYVIYRRKKA